MSLGRLGDFEEVEFHVPIDITNHLRWVMIDIIYPIHDWFSCLFERVLGKL